MFAFLNVLLADAEAVTTTGDAAASTTETATATASPYTSLISIGMLVLFVAVMYFVMIRPQRKQQKQEAKMRSELQIGDEIITIGGIYGRVVSLKDDSIVIESSGDRSKLQVTRTAVAQNLTVHDET